MSNSEKPYLIVVGIDYSPASDLALERAFELAAARPRAEVHVVNVVRLYGTQAVVDGPAEPAGFASVTLADATALVERYVEERRAVVRAVRSTRCASALTCGSRRPRTKLRKSRRIWRRTWSWSALTAGAASRACCWVRWPKRWCGSRRARCSWCARKRCPSNCRASNRLVRSASRHDGPPPALSIGANSTVSGTANDTPTANAIASAPRPRCRSRFTAKSVKQREARRAATAPANEILGRGRVVALHVA